MKKRIVSLVLAICMAVLAVPVFLVPATAAPAESFTTTFGYGLETWPSFTAGQTFDGYNGNWETGYFYEDGSYYTANGFDTQYNIISYVAGGQWNYTGIYLQNARYILRGSGFFAPGEDGAEPINKTAFSVTYVSPYEGTVTLGFSELTPQNPEMSATSPGQDFYLAIFLNEEMIWPTTGGEYSDPTDWAIIKATDAEETRTPMEQFEAMDRSAITNLQVTKDDRIEFAMARANSNYGYAAPTVTFDAGYLRVPSTMKSTFNASSSDWPEVGNGKGVKPLKQVSTSFTMGYIPAAGGTFTAYENYYRSGTEAWACSTGQDYIENGAILLTSGTTLLRGAFQFGTTTPATLYSAYEYTAIATGTADLKFNNITLLIDDGNDYVATDTGTVKAYFYVNGEQVGEAVTIQADGTATFPTGIELVKGDKVVLAMAPGSEDIVAVAADPLVSYTTVNSFMSEAVSDTYALRVEDTEVVFGEEFGVTFKAYATRDTYLNMTEAGVYVWDSTVAEADRKEANAQKYTAELDDNYAFVFDYTDLAAKEMADEIAVQVFVKVSDEDNGEQTILSDIKVGSVADYVQAQYEATTDVKLKNVLIAMLNYGAYAQIYFDYNTDHLANAGLAESEKEMDEDILYYASFDGQASGTRICNTEIESFALSLDNKIGIRVNIKVDPTELGNSKYIQVADSADTVADAERIDFTDNNPTYLIEDISLTDMSKTYYMRVAVQIGRTYYYGYVFSYSVESYAARMVDSTEPGLSDLVRSMMEFGKSINAYNN